MLSSRSPASARRLRWLGLLLALLTAGFAGCAAKTPMLEVHLFTALVAGPEFRTVETSVLVGTGSTSSSSIYDAAEASTRFGNDFSRGRGVATFTLPEGAYRVRVRLMRPNGTLLVERVIALSLAGDTVLPVHITRDCVGVVCPVPGGSAELSTCLAGRCVDPRCSVNAPEFCPDVDFCREPTDCGPTAECAARGCDDGVCVPTEGERPCAENFWCNPDVGAGCEPLTPSGAGSFPCGTICTMADRPCEFGYWNCDNLEAPVCTVLQYRPMDFVCAAGRVCDAVGECVDPSVPTVFLNSVSRIATTEAGGSSVFDLAISSRPSADVTLEITVSDSSEATVAPQTIVFTPVNWAIPQPVTVTGVDDFDADGDQGYTIVTSNTVSSDARFDDLNVDDLPGINSDDDSVGLDISPTAGLVTSEAGGTATFEVALDSRPIADVTVPLASDDPGEGATTVASLVFTVGNWNLPQTVTIVGVDDAIMDGTQSYTINLGAAISDDSDYAGQRGVVSVENTDNELAGVTVNPIAGLTTTEAGGTATFTVVLNSAPTADVAIALSSDTPAEGSVAPASITFTTGDWSVPRTVTVTGVDDVTDDGNVAYRIVTAAAISLDTGYAGINASDVTVTNTDDDVAAVTVSPSSGLVTSEGGGTTMFFLALETRPTDDVFVSLSVDDASEGSVLPAILAFSPDTWSVAQSVTVTGRDDVAVDGDVLYHVVTSAVTSSDAVYSGLAVDDASITNLDNEVPFVQEAYVKATNTQGGDFFGESVALAGDGNTMVVGAAREASNATGIGGNQADNSAPNAGAAFVYVRSGSVWAPQAYLKASNTDGGDQLGYVSAISNDGNTVVLSAPSESSNATGVGGLQSNNSASLSGAVYVFVRAGTAWTQQAYIKASNTASLDQFGYALALTPDGSTLVVSARSEDSNATGVDGNQANNSIQDSGAVYVFNRAGTVWTQSAYIKASNTGMYDSFGDSLAISSDGQTLAVGTWNERSSATGIDGNQADDSVIPAGAVYVFVRSGPSWAQQAYVKASNTGNDAFGYSVAITADGNMLAVGARNESSNATGVGGDQLNNSTQSAGAVYIFSRSGVIWSQDAYIKSWKSQAYQQFGEAIDISDDGTRLAVGAFGDDSGAGGVGSNPADTTRHGSGAVYLFARSGSLWWQTGYFKASNPGVDDIFGGEDAVSLSADGHTLAVGASGEQSTATGVGGVETDDTAPNAGAVYVFDEI
ncbi:MAG: hypothetical protein IPK60_01095 [Sandaracinaceae bacterium]|nr:hypothetical protein [Sandaracinaceae bacterium]